MHSDEELKLTYSAIIKKNHTKKVQVRFERKNNGKVDFAEGFVPEGKIEKSIGFTLEELEGLENYLSQNVTEIFEKAQKINDEVFWL